MQTVEGFINVCKYLIDTAGFSYVILGEMQSDRLEGEFSNYRQMNGANLFMTVGNVSAAFKKRLCKFSARYLEMLDTEAVQVRSHECKEISFENAECIEKVVEVPLTGHEEYAIAYVSGWLEKKCSQLLFSEEDQILGSSAKLFVEELSRGKLIVPHTSTFQFVKSSLCFMKIQKQEMCCQKQLMKHLVLMNNYFDFGDFSNNFLRRLANVLLKGLHNLEKDNEVNQVLYQTTVKKARLC